MPDPQPTPGISFEPLEVPQATVIDGMESSLSPTPRTRLTPAQYSTTDLTGEDVEMTFPEMYTKEYRGAMVPYSLVDLSNDSPEIKIENLESSQHLPQVIDLTDSTDEDNPALPYIKQEFPIVSVKQNSHFHHAVSDHELNEAKNDVSTLKTDPQSAWLQDPAEAPESVNLMQVLPDLESLTDLFVSDEEDEAEDDHLLDAGGEYDSCYELPENEDTDFDLSTTSSSSRKRSKAKSARSSTKRRKTAQCSTNGNLDEYDDNAMTIVRDFLTASLFDDAKKNFSKGEQPSFNSTTQKSALQQMRQAMPKASKKELKQLKNDIKGLNRRCHPDGQGGWKINGMLSSLENYQVTGLAEMRRREMGLEQPLGGLLAYQMGLGKTVLMIANIVLGKAYDNPGLPTLVVVPASILHQWEEEFATHVKPGVLDDIYSWCTGQKVAASAALKFLRAFEIIITTYDQVSGSYPKVPKDMPKFDDEGQRQIWWNKYVEKEMGVLHQLEYHRVVFDESQEIKNFASHRATACRTLRAKHRWCLSGTPVQNRLDEFYSYFRLFRIPRHGSPKEFRSNYALPNDAKCVRRLLRELRKWTIRKTHADTYLGSRLLNLPECHKMTLAVPMSSLEKAVYDLVEKRFYEKIHHLSGGDIGKLSQSAYTCALTLLLRLRQLTAHPLLIQDCIRDLLNEEDFAELHKIMDEPRAPHETDSAIIRHLRSMLQDPDNLNSLADFEEPEDDHSTPYSAHRTSKGLGGSYGVKNSFPKYLQEVEQETGQDKAIICPHCNSSLRQSFLTSCGHLYCYQCCAEMTYKARLNGCSHPICLVCKRPFTAGYRYEGRQTYALPNGEPTKDDIKRYKQSRNSAMKDTIKKWVDADGNIVHSTKTLAVKAKILEWIDKDPNVKIIIYSQFRPVIEIIRRMCDMEQWHCRQYHGGMNSEQKVNALEAFKKAPEMRILIASLKAGGVGLNLTEANCVIIMDLWWNEAVEDQAFARTYRRGQWKETFLFRPLMSGTIDQKLDEMQQRKKREISKAFSADSGGKMSRSEFVSLYSSMRDGRHGNSFTIPRTRIDDDANYPMPGGDIPGSHDDYMADDTNDF